MGLSDRLKEILDSELSDELNEITDLYVTLPSEVFSCLTLSLEGSWREIDNVWSARLDAADQKNNAKVHVHIAKTKHRSSKAKQVAWNDDGSRHDKKTFDAKLGKNKKVQAIAKKLLGLGESISLESKDSEQKVETLLLSHAPCFSNDGKEAKVEFYVEKSTAHLPAWLRW